MKNLHGFLACEEDEISLCEVDGRLHSMKSDFANISTFTNLVDNHPEIHITRDMLHCVGSGDENRALFLPVHEPFFKQVAKIIYERGLTEALQFVSRDSRNTSGAIKFCSLWALKAIDVLTKINLTFKTYRTINFSPKWPNSPVRCISWHPHCTKLAIAASDDSVRIYCSDSNLVPILKSKLQKNISDLCWRPCSSSEIAISCESCILLWTVDPNSVVTRPSTANSVILRRMNHSPVSSICWSPFGEYLVSASANDASILVWDVALDQTCALKRATGIGNILVQWSQDGTRLIAATSGIVFRVWDCRNWSADRWTITSGHIQSSCFSPCDSILFFVTSTEPILYFLSFCNSSGSSIFTSPQSSGSQQATALLDLSKTELLSGIVGGLVEKIDLCPSGKYLGIMFKETNYIALCLVQIKPNIQLTPSSLISGYKGEYPSGICFQKNFKDGSCLTIAWSTGRIQYFPIIYSDYKMTGKSDISCKNYTSF